MPESREPALGAPSFNCPHCGAYAAQFWYSCFASATSKLPGTPNSDVEAAVASLAWHGRNATRENLEKKKLSDYPSIEKAPDGTRNLYYAHNIYLSKCFSCGEVSLWLNKIMIFPRVELNVIPNGHMPEDIAIDFKEASSIVKSSPRGAAALLRLCVQKICIALGEGGKNLNDDIASLVRKGLSPKIQQALDTVRVIGNNAVHPGEIDLGDDYDTAVSLFSLVEIIV
jgi:hypothetical protein